MTFSIGTRFGRIARGTEMDCLVELERPLDDREVRLALVTSMRAVAALEANVMGLQQAVTELNERTIGLRQFK